MKSGTKADKVKINGSVHDNTNSVNSTSEKTSKIEGKKIKTILAKYLKIGLNETTKRKEKKEPNIIISVNGNDDAANTNSQAGNNFYNNLKMVKKVVNQTHKIINLQSNHFMDHKNQGSKV